MKKSCGLTFYKGLKGRFSSGLEGTSAVKFNWEATMRAGGTGA